ncbi:MAG: FAD-dependent oxidoreductase, partial [Burkholderiaceae bacterium]
MHIVVIGAGAWGTAMAMSAAAHPAGHAVTLWARDAAQAAAMQAARENARYLRGVPFPPSLQLASGDLAPLVARAELVIVAAPMAALRGLLVQLRGCPVPVAVSTRSPRPDRPMKVSARAPSARPRRVISARPRVMSAARA